MKILYEPNAAEQPFVGAPPKRKGRGDRAFSGDYWGAFSIENFCDVGGLSYTHDDAHGFLAYLEQFQPRNFWYQDSGVRPWAYYEDYDNWQDTYGLDACLAVYHSGHGGMDGAGKFYVPMGGDWGGLGCTATSDRMRLGNEQANYVFWSTCLSLRVLDGHNPIRTWSAANQGFRMMFGFETVSWDSPDYGKNFWEEWGKGKSLSSAWCDASWRIAHDQAPSVVACGATAAEAQDRLWNERFLSWDHVSNAWWWWRWYYASTATAMRELNRDVPDELVIAELHPPELSERNVRDVADRLGLELKLPGEVSATTGTFHLEEGETRASFGRDGSFEVRLAEPNVSNRDQIAIGEAERIAKESVRRFGLDQDVSLTFDRVRLEMEGGGTSDGSDQLEGPHVIGTTVQFRQTINDLPVLTPGTGEVRVSIDNDGNVTAVSATTRPVARLSDRPRNTTATPPENGAGPAADEGRIGIPRALDAEGYEEMLADEWTKQLATWVVRGRAPVQYATVPGTTEVGYDVRDNEAVVIAQRAIEVDLGHGYRKRYWVKTPIFE